VRRSEFLTETSTLFMVGMLSAMVAADERGAHRDPVAIFVTIACVFNFALTCLAYFWKEEP